MEAISIDDGDSDILPGSPPEKKARLEELPEPRSTANGTAEAGPRTSSGYFNKPNNSVAGPSRTPSTGGRPPRSSSSRAPLKILSTYAHSSSSLPPPLTSGSAFGSYTLGNFTEASEPRQRTKEQEKQHQAWQKRLADPNGIVPRRRSLKLDDAAAAEARALLGDDTPTGVETPGEAEIIDGDVEVDMEDEKAAETAGEVGGKLMAKFGASGKGAKKANGRTKKKEEIGPSGQTYTPLEKQFMEIKAQNPDVLLFMEGRSITTTGTLLITPSWIQIQVSWLANSPMPGQADINRFHGDDAKVSSRRFLLGQNLMLTVLTECIQRAWHRCVSPFGDLHVVFLR